MSDELIPLIAWTTFFAWGIPLGVIRSRWRKMIYKTNSWTINIKPVFWKEIKALFGFHELESKNDLLLLHFFRFYLLVYFALLVTLLILTK